MSFSFDNIKEEGKGGSMLREAGVQMGGKFVELVYTANEEWEGFDIKLETSDGRSFRERTFGPSLNKVFPRAKYSEGKQVGTETNQEAFERVQGEISKKLFYMASCMVEPEALKEAVGSARDLKTLVDRINKVITEGNTEVKINFLTMWKNSQVKRRSNLILADRVKMFEITQFDEEGKMKSPGISFTKYQIEKCMVEEFKDEWKNTNESTNNDAVEMNGGSVSDLPF